MNSIEQFRKSRIIYAKQGVSFNDVYSMYKAQNNGKDLSEKQIQGLKNQWNSGDRQGLISLYNTTKKETEDKRQSALQNANTQLKDQLKTIATPTIKEVSSIPTRETMKQNDEKDLKRDLAKTKRWSDRQKRAAKLFNGKISGYDFNKFEDVVRFQRDNKLKVDGLVGQDTWTALNKASNKNYAFNPQRSNPSPKDNSDSKIQKKDTKEVSEDTKQNEEILLREDLSDWEQANNGLVVNISGAGQTAQYGYKNGRHYILYDGDEYSFTPDSKHYSKYGFDKDGVKAANKLFTDIINGRMFLNNGRGTVYNGRAYYKSKDINDGIYEYTVNNPYGPKVYYAVPDSDEYTYKNHGNYYNIGNDFESRFDLLNPNNIIQNLNSPQSYNKPYKLYKKGDNVYISYYGFEFPIDQNSIKYNDKGEIINAGEIIKGITNNSSVNNNYMQEIWNLLTNTKEAYKNSNSKDIKW